MTMANPQQPSLRSFIVMDQLPAACILFEATGDHVAPHIRAGDFAVIDTADREPMHGELFLVEWESGGRRQLIEVARFDGPERIPTWDGVTEYWNALWYAPMRFVDGREAETMRWFDGPYRAAGLASRIVGRVVGIYQPDFRRQLVVAGGR